MPVGKKSVACDNPACKKIGQTQVVGSRQVACDCGRKFARKTLAPGVPATK
jgi:hypothetical protein